VRVVICEDLALLRDGLKRLLQDNGMEVVAEVADGDRFVSAAVGHKPDVCVVDVRLPPTFRDEDCGPRSRRASGCPGSRC
jgi:DNA-binding NarL/FixJ family response regulator